MNARRIRSALTWRARRYVNRARAWLPHRPYPAILLYHRIADETFDPWGEAVAPTNFREQLEWLAGNRTLLRLTDFVDHADVGMVQSGSGPRLPAKSLQDGRVLGHQFGQKF